MTRSPRPSDVYRLPQAAAETPDRPEDRRPRGPGRAPLLGVGVAVALLLLVAVLSDTTSGPAGPDALDVASEDQAVAALGLYAAQQEAAGAVGRPLLAQPGPHEMTQRAGAHAERVAAALRGARTQPDPQPLGAFYWSSPGHDWFLQELQTLTRLADDVALLAAVHDTLYGGAGLVAAGEAEQALVNRFRAGRPPGPALAQWSDALLAELDGRDASAAAATGRDATERHWVDRTGRLQPVEAERLRDFVAALPAPLVEALRGHPVAGPALERLEP